MHKRLFIIYGLSFIWISILILIFLSSDSVVDGQSMGCKLFLGGNSAERGDICLTIVNKMATKGISWSFLFEMEQVPTNIFVYNKAGCIIRTIDCIDSSFQPKSCQKSREGIHAFEVLFRDLFPIFIC